MQENIISNRENKTYIANHNDAVDSTVVLGQVPETWCNLIKLKPEQTEFAAAILEQHGPVSSNLLYKALATARLEGAKTVIYRASHSDDPVVLVLGLRALATPSSANAPFLAAAPIEQALHAAYERGSELDKNELRGTFKQQIEDTMKLFVGRFFAGPWARAVYDRKLSREQYLSTLFNLHHYVRFTTRLLGQAVSISPSSELRSHFAEHLRGEINHELIIERDLKHLGEDTEHLIHTRYPNAATRAFMVVQQSMVAFERDPVLFMACPLAAEGISANLDQRFLDSLRDCVRGFGVSDADKATLFFSSHIMTDGGDDGHWEATMRILDKHIANETKLGEFLTVLELACVSIENSFNANITELALFGR